MDTKFSNLVKTTKGFLSKHSPEILTGIGVTGMITSTVLAVKATPRALQLLEEVKVEGEKISVKTMIKVAWRPYVPATILGIASISCIIGASAVNTKRNAAIATAYALSERTLLTYRDKVIETIGEKKEKEIKGKIAQDEIDNKPVSKSQVIITSGGNSLCMDSISGRYFRSSIDKINKVVNELNRRMKYENYISLDEFYSELGLDTTKNSSYIGWNIDDGYIEVEYDTCLSDDGQPCLYVDYKISPKYEFDRMF